jgi:hypothetical protein
VDGSFDPRMVPREEEGAGGGTPAPRPSTAWGSYDGVNYRGGALPPLSGNYAAELVAIDKTLEQCPAGARVFILSDCRGALAAIEAEWRRRHDSGEAHDSCAASRHRSNGNVIDSIVRRRAQIHADKGVVVLMYAPAHTGGIAPNAYADAAAKAHLHAVSTEPDVQVFLLLAPSHV